MNTFLGMVFWFVVVGSIAGAIYLVIRWLKKSSFIDEMDSAYVGPEMGGMKESLTNPFEERTPLQLAKEVKARADEMFRGGDYRLEFYSDEVNLADEVIRLNQVLDEVKQGFAKALGGAVEDRDIRRFAGEWFGELACLREVAYCAQALTDPTGKLTGVMVGPEKDQLEGALNNWAQSFTPKPIDMVLFCPRCHKQHIDEPSEGWENPPHRSHKCFSCSCVWRPADVPTNGVEQIETAGKSDTLLYIFSRDRRRYVRTGCVYEARSRSGDVSMSAPVEPWCRTHGWDCPNAQITASDERYALKA